MAATTSVNNFMVPATGTPNSYPISGVFSASPFRVDFREVSLNGEQFVPQGLFVDNTAGAAPLVIAVQGMNYSLRVPAGAQLQTQYPAPIDQIVEITGNGQASIVFCDFPVLPFSISAASGASAVTIADGADVTLGAQADAPAANDTGVFSLMSFVKRISGTLTSLLTSFTGSVNPPSTGTVSNVGITAVSQIALAANTNRLGAIFVNDGPNIVYLLLTTTGPAAANTCSVILQAGGSFILGRGDYDGNCHAIGNVAGGTLRVTEFTA